eukprot:TRINITY_DN1305_c0_g1_i1.p1 TRINITY_DN1305_c0_g1~~TRINITY_DN1305_c0_g1_i1.p1  ORF type:complete len:779 (+),score=289.13 TRINITY_DN1305_c0_g1_i1:45-2381(+)
MGLKGKRGGGGRRPNRGGKKENVWKHQPWNELILHNDLFVEYYKGQNIVPPEEWDDFYKHLQTPLPTTFRITASSHVAEALLARVKEAGYHHTQPFEVDGEVVKPLKPIPWYPNDHAWQTSVPRKVLRKLPELENFHQFLIAQSEQGNITRQEAVSMLPPLFLDVQPQHTVLDMCAAPGSKTTQIIESLHAASGNAPPKGLVIANDVDKDRCYMLVHQTQRLASPAIMVTNNPAQLYPRLPIRLDRILADVPCSGDGTLRKSADVWRKWAPALGSGLHILQTQIAYRAAQMLVVGGKMVYSTCSLNPAEDEAVVMELLRMTKGALRLLDCSQVLPGFKYSKGISQWRVMDRDNQWYNSYDDLPYESRRKIRPSHFAPTKEEAEKANLQYCMRVLPHQQDTGGFFIAVLEKTAVLPPLREYASAVPSSSGEPAPAAAEASVDEPMPAALTTDEPSTTTSTTTTSTTTTAEKPIKKENDNTSTSTNTTTNTTDTPTTSTDEKAVKKEDDDADKKKSAKRPAKDSTDEKKEEGEGERPAKRQKKERTWVEDPFIPLTEAMQEKLKSLCDYYGLVDFPMQQVFSRSIKSQKLYFVSEAIGNLLNLMKNAKDSSGPLVINTGVKLFNKHELSEHGYRVCQDSLQWLLPMITKRKVTIEHQDLLHLLTHDNTYPNRFTASAEAQINQLESGVVVFLVNANVSSASAGMGFVGWYGRKSVHLLIKKKELVSLRNLFCPKPANAEKSAAGSEKSAADSEKSAQDAPSTTTTATTTTDSASAPSETK